MAGNGGGRDGVEPKGSALYEIIKGIDFERRELLAKPEGTGLFDLIRKGPGDAAAPSAGGAAPAPMPIEAVQGARDRGYRCYACTLCERTCPVDCIEVKYCPEHPEVPFDAQAARAAAQAAGGPPLDMSLFDRVIAGIRSGSGLVEALHATQEAYGYLPRAALENIAEEMRLPLSRLYGVASFYSQFRLSPVGKHVIEVCMGTACHVAGAPLVVEAFMNELEIPVGTTTPDGLFTLQTVNCVGACALAPVVRIGADQTHGRMGPRESRRLISRLRKEEAGT